MGARTSLESCNAGLKSQGDHRSRARGAPLRNVAQISICLAIVFLLLTCADRNGSSGAWTGMVDTLESGTVMVRNGERGVWGNDAPERTLDVDLRLGTASGEGPELFGDVRDIDASPLCEVANDP